MVRAGHEPPALNAPGGSQVSPTSEDTGAVRPWVLTEEGRRSRLGVELECNRCDEAGRAVAEAVREALRTAAQRAYEEGGLSGLCAEGRWELALDALGAADLVPVIRRARSPARGGGAP